MSKVERAKAPTPSADANSPGEAPPLRTGKSIATGIDRFHATLDAIRQVEESIIPQATIFDEERMSPAALAAVLRLTPDKRVELEEWLGHSSLESDTTTDEAVSAQGDIPSSDPAAEATNPDPSDAEAATLADSSAANAGPAAPSTDTPSRKNIISILGGEAILLEFVQHLYRNAISPRSENLLRRALLVTAFGAFEVLVGLLSREFYLAHPGALGDEPKFTLRELQEFETLDDARDAAISSRVDNLLKGEFSEWERWFEQSLKLTLANYCIDRADLDEMFQRRHVIVHNDGRVSRLYLRRLQGRTDLQDLDDLLPVTRSYLESALDHLDALGTLLGCGVRCKLFASEESDAIDEVEERTMALMKRDRWTAVRKLCAIGEPVGVSAAQKEVFKANGWLAEKRLGNFEDVVGRIRGWDVSALHPRFSFVRSVLLDELDAAFPVAEQLLTSKELSARDFASWPVLAEFREDARYQALIDENAPPEDVLDP